MKRDDTDADQDEVPIVVEAYGVKVNIKSRPHDLGEEVPLSWREVPRRVNQHLIRIAVAPTRLVVEVLEGAARLVRGLSPLPSSLANRVQRVHNEADFCEGQLQEISRDMRKRQLAPNPTERLLTEETPDKDRVALAVSQIQALLQRYRDRGFDAHIMLGPEGKPIIVLGTPAGSEPQILEAIEQAGALLVEPSKTDPTELRHSDVERAVLEALYEAWEQRIDLSLDTVQERLGLEKSDFRAIVDRLMKREYLFTSTGSSYSFQLTLDGIRRVEWDGTVPQVRAQWHRNIRRHIMESLANLYDTDGGRAHMHYEKIAESTPVNDKIAILRDLSLLVDTGDIEAASTSSFRITEQGRIRWRGRGLDHPPDYYY